MRDPGLQQQQQQQHHHLQQPVHIGGAQGYMEAFQPYGGEQLLPFNSLPMESAYPMVGSGSIQFAPLPAGLGGGGRSPPRYLPGGGGFGVGGAAVGLTGSLGIPAGYQTYSGPGMAGVGMPVGYGGMQRSC